MELDSSHSLSLKLNSAHTDILQVEYTFYTNYRGCAGYTAKLPRYTSYNAIRKKMLAAR